MTIDDQSLVRNLIGVNMIRYEVLDELYEKIDCSQYKMAVMMVDGHAIFSRLFHMGKIDTTYAGAFDETVRDLVVGFMNVLGHYRRYMSTHMRLDNDIYVMFNRERPVYNCTYYRDFNLDRVERYDPEDPKNGFISQAVGMAWEFILGLSPYFEGIYCLNNQGIDDFALMARMEFPDILVTVFTRSQYALQLLRPNYVQLCARNYKAKHQLITRDTCYNEGVFRKMKLKSNGSLTPEMLPLYWSILGCSDVNIKNTKLIPRGSTVLVPAMEKMVKDGLLSPDTTITGFLENLGIYVSLPAAQLKLAKSKIENSYKALSARLSALAITPDQLANISAQIYDVYDQQELDKLNDLLVHGSLDPEILNLESLNMSAASYFRDEPWPNDGY